MHSTAGINLVSDFKLMDTTFTTKNWTEETEIGFEFWYFLQYVIHTSIYG